MTAHLIRSFPSSRGVSHRPPCSWKRGLCVQLLQRSPSSRKSYLRCADLVSRVNKPTCAVRAARGTYKAAQVGRQTCRDVFNLPERDMCIWITTQNTGVVGGGGEGPEFGRARGSCLLTYFLKPPSSDPRPCPSRMRRRKHLEASTRKQTILSQPSPSPYPCPRVVRKCKRSFLSHSKWFLTIMTRITHWGSVICPALHNYFFQPSQWFWQINGTSPFYRCENTVKYLSSCPKPTAEARI